jgi:uncharacterized protein (TIGR02680 family)
MPTEPTESPNGSLFDESITSVVGEGKPLPIPQKARWQPLRSGLLNLFRFDKVEFPFADGRLLLRGNNGSGKSRVLALQLPFLIDGETSSHRVEPDGDPAKRMEWNLLMGDQYDDRLGYTWIEFGRIGEDDTPAYLTLGCGLRASKGRGIHGKWFFTTSLRPGLDFELHNDRRQPLSRPQLADILGQQGTLYTSARDYRRAIDRQLFGLGGRYEPLIELLIRLRQPKLSEKLDESVLSDALSEALTPLPENLINEVAESFRGLEADRTELTNFQQAQSAVGTFLEDYRAYVQVAARRRAQDVRLTHSAYEQAQRRLREAEEALTTATREREALEAERSRLDEALEGAQTALATLRESPEMRSAEALDHARNIARKTAQTAEDSQRDTHRAAEAARKAGQDQAEAEKELTRSGQQARDCLQRCRRTANDAGLLDAHHPHFPQPTAEAAPVVLPEDLSATRRALDKAIRQRDEAILLIKRKNANLAATKAQHDRAKEALSKAVDALEEARSDARAAETAFSEAAAQQIERFRQWRRGTTELRPAETESLLEAWETWLDTLDGPSPFAQASDEAYATHTRKVTTERSQLDQEKGAHQQTIAEHRAEIEHLASGAQPPPPAPPTRPAERKGRPGAPFWQTCDFSESLPTEHRAGLEAALQAAGILDAWVLPDGRLADPASLDAYVVPALDQLPPLTEAESLAHWLKPALNPDDPGAAALSDSTITALLRCLGNQAEKSPYWFSHDGHYQLGPLRGHWEKPEAEYIGESSRAAARKRRIAFLHEEIATLEKLIAQIEARLQHLTQREATARQERQDAPTDNSIRERGYERTAAQKRVISLTDREAEARREAERKAQAETAALDERDRTAADLRLSEWVDHLADLTAKVSEYKNALSALWPTLDGFNRDQRIVRQAIQRASEQAQHLAENEARLQNARREAAAARQKYETLEASSGKAAREILAKMSETEQQVSRYKSALHANEKQRSDVLIRKTRAEESVSHETHTQEQHSHSRQTAIDALRQFTAERLLGDADPALADAEAEKDFTAVSRAVDLARRAEQRLQTVDASDEQWNRRQKGIFTQVEQLRDSLIPHGHSPETRQLDDLIIIRIPFQGRQCSISELHDAFAREIHDRGRLLDEREREIIENHLLSETATEIQALLRAAEEWVAETNRELESRPTSTGMRLRFKWEPDPNGPAGLPTARAQLHQRAEMWNETQRAGLAQFFQELIESHRTANPAASWPELLGTALDYRRWHRFFIEREQNKQWKRLTRRTHGTGSGGEKALALTLPQFAAAAAHYRSAAPHAPRLILLDEVFVGIDSEMRANCMELLAQFDLDFIMTSEREWGCYPALPALSICQLSTRPGFNAVGVTRWLWNGREKRPAST